MCCSLRNTIILSRINASCMPEPSGLDLVVGQGVTVVPIIGVAFSTGMLNVGVGVERLA